MSKTRKEITKEILKGLIEKYANKPSSAGGRIITTVALSVSNYVILKALSQETGEPMSEIVDKALNVLFTDCEKACEKFSDYYIERLSSIK